MKFGIRCIVTRGQPAGVIKRVFGMSGKKETACPHSLQGTLPARRTQFFGSSDAGRQTADPRQVLHASHAGLPDAGVMLSKGLAFDIALPTDVAGADALFLYAEWIRTVL